ncbi:MAG: TetR family transcriptional regulator [Phenylobacterium sp.]|nr:TetR family transcriptional regulator [Phenylobacterium sp.]MDB5435504.1 TetR family transcriptional regulator [Phenylobacterium sp.]MDB5464147.1 TetR family transcriptional regulator [Phenylobacterium sp.]
MVQNTRDALISAAARLLDRGGPAAVTLRAVAKAVGVSHNAPYKHFHDKQDLLAAIAARELSRPGLSNAAAPTDPVQALRRMAQAYVDWAQHHPERFKLTFGPWRGGTDELGVSATAARGRFVDAVVRAQAAGQLVAGDPERVTALILALAHGAADLALGGHLSREGKGHADPGDLLDDLFALMAPRP